MAAKIVLTQQEDEFVKALDALRHELGLGMGRFGQALGGIPIDTMKSLLYRRRRPSRVIVAYVDQTFRSYLQDHPDYSQRTLVERVIAAALAIPH